MTMQASKLTMSERDGIMIAERWIKDIVHLETFADAETMSTIFSILEIYRPHRDDGVLVPIHQKLVEIFELLKKNSEE